MTWLLVGIALWVVVLLVVLSFCRAAARADEQAERERRVAREPAWHDAQLGRRRPVRGVARPRGRAHRDFS